jgi:CRISPR-associated protein Csx10
VGGVEFLRMDIELRAPVIAAVVGGDPNTVHTATSLPGSMLRGAAAGVIARTAGGDPGSDPVFRRLILDGDVRWLNALPVAGGAAGGSRSLPAPISLRRPRASEGLESDAPVQLTDIAAEWRDGLRGSRAEYVAAGSPADLVSVDVSARVHHQRDRVRGRPWTERSNGGDDVPHGAVYSYESIDLGQRFAALVQIRGELDELEAMLRAHVPAELLLGRSRRATYGGAAGVTWAASRQLREHQGEWSLVGGLRTGERARLLLTAPAVVRDPVSGQADPAVLGRVVESALGGRVSTTVFAGRTIVGGYNRHWVSPLPQEPAAAAGTVLSVLACEDVSFADLLELEHSGVGERRIDGFGSVVWLEQATREVSARAVTATERAVEVTVPLSSLAEQIESRITTDRRNRRVAEAIGAVQVRQPPRASLSGRLRIPLRRGGPGLDTLRAWFGSGGAAPELRRIALDQLGRCTVRFSGGEWLVLADVLRALLRIQGGGAVPAWLNDSFDTPPALTIDGGPGRHVTTDEELAPVLDRLLRRVQRAASEEINA